jgi:ArsR family transcriptional regulator
MPEIASLQLFKILSDETRLGIVLLLREMGAVRMRSLHSAGTITTQDLPPSGDASGKWPVAGSQAGKWVHYRLSPHIPSWAALVIEQAWLSQQDDVQAIARKLASANCSGSGKAVCI